MALETLFELGEKYYYEPKRVTSFWNKNYIEYDSNSDKHGNLSLDEYLNKTRPQLKNIIINPQNSDAYRIQLTIEMNSISSKDGYEERVMHSGSSNTKYSLYGDANNVVDQLIKSLCSRYQKNLETLMKGSNFISESFQLMYYKLKVS